MNRLCKWCAKRFKCFPSAIKRGGGKFCSISCGISYRNKYAFNPAHSRDIKGDKNPMYGKGFKIAGEKNGMFGRRGKDCPNYKGEGRHQRKDGYYREYDSSRKDGRSLEHRKVVERHLGRVLTDKEVIHHIDGNKSNNSLTNLKIMTRSEHSRLHMLKRMEGGDVEGELAFVRTS